MVENISIQPCNSLGASFGEWTPQNSMNETTGQANPTEPVEILLQQETDFVNVVAPVTESPRTQRKLCLETLKNIQNSLYIVDDPATYIRLTLH